MNPKTFDELMEQLDPYKDRFDKKYASQVSQDLKDCFEVSIVQMVQDKVKQDLMTSFDTIGGLMAVIKSQARTIDNAIFPTGSGNGQEGSGIADVSTDHLLAQNEALERQVMELQAALDKERNENRTNISFYELRIKALEDRLNCAENETTALSDNVSSMVDELNLLRDFWNARKKWVEALESSAIYEPVDPEVLKNCDVAERKLADFYEAKQKTEDTKADIETIGKSLVAQFVGDGENVDYVTPTPADTGAVQSDRPSPAPANEPEPQAKPEGPDHPGEDCEGCPCRSICFPKETP